MERELIAVADIRLDSENPRHKPVRGQREIIEALLEEQGGKLVTLAKDIAENGPSPIDTLLVVKDGSGYVALEGNRRLAAIKLLANPDLTRIVRYRRRFHALARGMAPIHDMWCAVAANRKEGRHWQEIRHTGDRGGAGTIRWGTEATARFHGLRGTQAERALVFLDAVEKAFPGNGVLQDAAVKVRKGRLTTLGRVISDPDCRRELGISIEDGTLRVHYPEDQVERAASRLIGDLSSAITVADVDTKELRRKYMGRIRPDLPDPAGYSSQFRELGTVATSLPKPVAEPKLKHAVPARPFDGVQLVNLGGRVSQVLDEVQRIDLDKFPHTAGVMLRVVIELAIEDLYTAKNWKRAAEFKDDIRNVLRRIDSTDRDPRFAAVRAGLQDGSSVMAARTMHAYVHNPYYNPTATEIRTIAANYSAFLSGIDSLA